MTFSTCICFRPRRPKKLSTRTAIIIADAPSYIMSPAWPLTPALYLFGTIARRVVQSHLLSARRERRRYSPGRSPPNVPSGKVLNIVRFSTNNGLFCAFGNVCFTKSRPNPALTLYNPNPEPRLPPKSPTRERLRR